MTQIDMEQIQSQLSLTIERMKERIANLNLESKSILDSNAESLLPLSVNIKPVQEIAMNLRYHCSLLELQSREQQIQQETILEIANDFQLLENVVLISTTQSTLLLAHFLDINIDLVKNSMSLILGESTAIGKILSPTVCINVNRHAWTDAFV